MTPPSPVVTDHLHQYRQRGAQDVVMLAPHNSGGKSGREELCDTGPVSQIPGDLLTSPTLWLLQVFDELFGVQVLNGSVLMSVLAIC